ncbi:MAG: hypothetical protein LWX11_06770 [Firmicutes bacterium]|nr:hypothetical protein [Bacillota bacterium]
MNARPFRLIAAATLLLGLWGCVDPVSGGSTGGTALYAFDSSTGQVLVWSDLGAAYDAGALPATSRTLTGASLDQVKNLGWGGMAMDATNNRLFLVSAAGKVVRIERVRSQNGALSSFSDIALFTLGNSNDRLGSSSVFGQAAVDTSSGTLYVTETTDTDARVWVVANPANIQDGTTVPLAEMRSTFGTDSKGGGVAASQGSVYAYFGGGDNITNLNTGTTYSGARVRRGSGNSFPGNTQVLVYQNDRLGNSGSLAFDTSNTLLYVLRTSSGAALNPPVVIYKAGAFTSGFDQTWDATLGTTQSTLRYLAHPGNKDWLVAGEMVSDKGTAILWVWKNPSQSGTVKALSAGSGEIRGVALDGSN